MNADTILKIVLGIGAGCISLITLATIFLVAISRGISRKIDMLLYNRDIPKVEHIDQFQTVQPKRHIEQEIVYTPEEHNDEEKEEEEQEEDKPLSFKLDEVQDVKQKEKIKMPKIVIKNELKKKKQPAKDTTQEEFEEFKRWKMQQKQKV